MSVSSEVQRTLVKSPPELWAELSDPTCLARHLGELGEIRITGTDPERLVDWEATSADGATVNGRVEIEASGWGTRVTLFASRELVEQESERAPEPELAPETELAAESKPEPESEAVEASPAVEPAPEPESQPAPPMVEIAQELESTIATEPELEPVHEPEPIVEPRKGFFARLFRRRKPQPVSEATLEPEPEPDILAGLAAEEPAPEPEPVVAAEEPELLTEPRSVAIVVEEVTAGELVAETKPEPEEPADATTAPDIAAELAELEEQTTAVLTGVLDRLGAAHHRPFSRA